jgi:hypothetical protein
VCLFFSGGAFGWVITDNGLVRPTDTVRYVPFGVPGDWEAGKWPTGSYRTWWHDGGAPYGHLNSEANDDYDNKPDKNHDVSSWNDIVAPPAKVNSYMRRLDSTAIPGILKSASWGAIFGDYENGAYQDLRGAPDHTFPEGTQGTPLHFHGENQASGVVFYDVKDEMLVQFFSCDKNDGYMEVLVNGVSVDNIDTWCQGWWYFVLSGLGPTAPNTVMLRTRYDPIGHTSIESPHINTLDLDNLSQNWLHRLPGDVDYPKPDDFHIFYIAYNYVQVPEPATLTLLGVGLAGSAWLRHVRRRRMRC